MKMLQEPKEMNLVDCLSNHHLSLFDLPRGRMCTREKEAGLVKDGVTMQVPQQQRAIHTSVAVCFEMRRCLRRCHCNPIACSINQSHF